jgi:hypothetical protein
VVLSPKAFFHWSGIPSCCDSVQAVNPLVTGLSVHALKGEGMESVPASVIPFGQNPPEERDLYWEIMR